MANPTLPSLPGAWGEGGVVVQFSPSAPDIAVVVP